MTLRARLSVFFLTTLAVVLGGFSLALYELARHYLARQSEERLEATLRLLLAAAEVTPQALEWEPAERHMPLREAYAGEAPAWLVSDADGNLVDRSVPKDAFDFVQEARDRLRPTDQSSACMQWQGQRWLFRQHGLRIANSAPPTPRRRREKKYSALVITVGISLEPMHAALRQLAFGLTGLSLVIWLAAFGAGQLVCRRALLPVTRMAAAARNMDGADLNQRLPPANSRDELEDFTRAFNSLLDRLQESFERQRRFSGDASHQLRTPLATLLGQIEVALRRERPQAEYRQVLATVQRQAERLRRIVDALLFLARADADALLPEREPMDVRPWLVAHGQTWGDHARAADLVVRAESTQPVWVNVHPVLLGELVNVLLDNACKYSRPGQPITLSLRTAPGTVELTVADAGCGIPAADIAQLFQPFFRSAEARRQGIEGLGLGLAVARRLAEAFGGTLQVASRVGHGCSFTLVLPAGLQDGKAEEPKKIVDRLARPDTV